MKVHGLGRSAHFGIPFPRGRGAPETRRGPLVEVAGVCSRTRLDPKDGELCPDRTRADETWWRFRGRLTAIEIGQYLGLAA
ncbi:hypothetical protein JTE90_026916 [Oedothorax gibbosus]|uniref:Uncharacterized protein n=1 Tax=Oedothorax gibbosus TaxID=931172 RepID=A0AAV6TCR0_9ARAC|nr:hypothetical protein JTE90_026916 [Oedothorax gibbosus]